VQRRTEEQLGVAPPTVTAKKTRPLRRRAASKWIYWYLWKCCLDLLREGAIDEFFTVQPEERATVMNALAIIKARMEKKSEGAWPPLTDHSLRMQARAADLADEHKRKRRERTLRTERWNGDEVNRAGRALE
jgi:hypothetical protein